MGIFTINSLVEGNGISIPVTRIRRPTYGAHHSVPNHISGENTAVGVSELKHDYDYKYNTKFQIWKENMEFDGQNISMS